MLPGDHYCPSWVKLGPPDWVHHLGRCTPETANGMVRQIPPKTSSHGAHLPLELVYRPGAEPRQFRRLADARSFRQLPACPIELVGLG